MTATPRTEQLEKEAEIARRMVYLLQRLRDEICMTVADDSHVARLTLVHVDQALTKALKIAHHLTPP